jgi:ribosomal protein L34E
MHININISCASCGGNRLTFPFEATVHEPVTCDDCGHQLGTMETVQRLVEEAVLELSQRRPC